MSERVADCRDSLPPVAFGTWRLERVIGEYIKTPKNAMVENIYARLGFTPDGNRFTAQTDGFTENKTYIKEEK